ncbi:hypothetical protein EDD36DRAFT_275637 [Exophiala viscosa]|uniref:Uncharacterized protein n=1 Tax=Exophiala viscosa TaxID=2486360 RepID=A0AAN6DU20_9EURO|nr:hypothetical protein EDD36DRAFT_275637 [Exophiala viscosa]
MAVPLIAPCLFNMYQMPLTASNNEYSCSPLYQQSIERSQKERNLRSQRVGGAPVRKDQKTLSPAYSTSNNDSYTCPSTNGPPAYTDRSIRGTNEHAGRQPGDLLPTYDAAIGRQPEDPAKRDEATLLSVREEKSRLRRGEEQYRQLRDDKAMVQTLSRDDLEEPEVQGERSDKTDGRRKSTARKIGRWFADTASGFTAKQERE